MNKILLALMLCTQVFGSDKVLYGNDDRRDWYELSQSEKTMARSVGAMVEKSYLVEGNGTYTYTEKLPTLITRKRLCRDVKYWDQTVIGVCSGFLIGDDILLTAGHCIDHIEDSCSNFSWVFSYNMVGPENLLNEISKEAVYNCKEVLHSKTTNRLDYAVIKLDRPVRNRSALRLNRKASIAKGEELFTMGHPLGLPLKFADNGKVLDKTSDYLFTASLDTFAGNSGSPVLNAKTKKVEGVLVRGKTDYAEDYDPKFGVCYTVNRCNDDGKNCSEPDGADGESVMIIEKIFEDLRIEGVKL